MPPLTVIRTGTTHMESSRENSAVNLRKKTMEVVGVGDRDSFINQNPGGDVENGDGNGSI